MSLINGLEYVLDSNGVTVSIIIIRLNAVKPS